MRAAAAELEFEKAAAIRDQILELRQQLDDLKTPEWQRIWELRRKTGPAAAKPAPVKVRWRGR
jgi:hypothetical protein